MGTLDAEIWNRYRLRFAKLSEILPRSEGSLTTIRMTDQLRSGMRDWASFARFGWDDKERSVATRAT